MGGGGWADNPVEMRGMLSVQIFMADGKGTAISTYHDNLVESSMAGTGAIAPALLLLSLMKSQGIIAE